MGRLRQIWATTEAEQAEAFELRRRVFVDEQGIPESLDDDGGDAEAHHLVIKDGDAVIATGRLQVEAARAELSRIAVDAAFRRGGIGRCVVVALEARAIGLGCRQAILHPHAYLERFYRELGYETVDGVEVTAGRHRLIEMTKTLRSDKPDRRQKSASSDRSKPIGDRSSADAVESDS